MNNLVSLLAGLYPELGDAQLVLRQAGMRPEDVHLEGKAVVRWSEILAEASKLRCVEKIVQIAAEKYPAQSSALFSALDLLSAGSPSHETPEGFSKTPVSASSLKAQRITTKVQEMMTILYGEVVGGEQPGPSVETIFRIAEIPNRARDGRDRAVVMRFESPVDAAEYALTVRDRVHYCDWRANGIAWPPQFRMAISMVKESQTDSEIWDAKALEIWTVVQTAQNEPVTQAGTIWTTEELKTQLQGSEKGRAFHFEDVGSHMCRVYRSHESEAISEGRVGPLLDEQHYRREEAVRRFSLLWLLLDQLPAGSWGRSVPGWMNEVWKDVTTITRDPHMEDEGGFETTILSMQLLHELFGDKIYQKQDGVWSRAINYLRKRKGPNGFGTSGTSRQGSDTIDVRPRHTALVGWLFGHVLKERSLHHGEYKTFFQFAATSLLDQDSNHMRSTWLADRNPTMLYLAAWHTVRELESSDWATHFPVAQRNRMVSAWEAVEGDLLARTLASRYSDSHPNALATESDIYPQILPYGQFVRMETYTHLACTLLVDSRMRSELRERLGRGIETFMTSYHDRFGLPEQRYTRERLRTRSDRGVIPYGLTAWPLTHSDLGVTAMLFRVLRSPSIRNAIWPNGSPPNASQVRYYLSEDLVELFDRYLLDPRLYELTNASMFACLLAGDATPLKKRVIDACREVIDHPPPVDMTDLKISDVLSEKRIDDYLDQVVSRPPNAGPSDPGIQMATHSLARLLRSKLRPGRYVREALTENGKKRLSQQTLSRTKEQSFCEQYNRVWGEYPDQVILAPFLKLLSEKAAILDLGCGPGQYALEFAKRGHSVILLDASEAFLEIAQNRLKQHGYPSVPKVQADVFNQDWRGSFAVEYEEHRFDAVWCSGLFAHVPKPDQHELLRWLARLLKPGGLLFVNVMIDNPALIARDGRYFTYLGSPSEFEVALTRCRYDVELLLQKEVRRNTYGDPFFSMTWANFYARRESDQQETPVEVGSAAALLTSQAYERSASTFRRAHVSRPVAPGYPSREQLVEGRLDRLVHHLGDVTSIRVLDAGCGLGDHVLAMARRKWKAVGIDISAEMIIDALKDREQQDTDIQERTQFIVGDIRHLPDQIGFFQAVLCVTALQHIPRQDGSLEQVLRAFYRVLLPNGILRIDIRLGRESGYDPDLRYVEAFERADDVLGILKRIGFQLLEQVPFNLPPVQNSFRRPIPIEYVDLWLRKAM